MVDCRRGTAGESGGDEGISGMREAESNPWTGFSGQARIVRQTLSDYKAENFKLGGIQA
jgi:hypothetical protein